MSVSAEGRYLTYQLKKNGTDLPGETNATLVLTDANASLHDGTTAVVSNEFGSWNQERFHSRNGNEWVGWLVEIDESSGTVASDSSGNGMTEMTNGPI